MSRLGSHKACRSACLTSSTVPGADSRMTRSATDDRPTRRRTVATTKTSGNTVSVTASNVNNTGCRFSTFGSSCRATSTLIATIGARTPSPTGSRSRRSSSNDPRSRRRSSSTKITVRAIPPPSSSARRIRFSGGLSTTGGHQAPSGQRQGFPRRGQSDQRAKHDQVGYLHRDEGAVRTVCEAGIGIPQRHHREHGEHQGAYHPGHRRDRADPEGVPEGQQDQAAGGAEKQLPGPTLPVLVGKQRPRWRT